MEGLSTLATIISVLAFPMIFLVLLYPHLAGPRGKWYAVCLYSGISVGTMLVAVFTSPEPQRMGQPWGWADWLVVAFGGSVFLVYLVKKYRDLKKEALAKRGMGNKNKDGQSRRQKQGKKKRKLS